MITTTEFQGKTTPALPLLPMVTFACLSLFMLDKDIHSLGDLLHFEILLYLLLYSIPAFWLCNLIFKKYARRNKKIKGLLLSLAIGIPVSFSFTVLFFYAIKYMTITSSL